MRPAGGPAARKPPGAGGRPGPAALRGPRQRAGGYAAQRRGARGVPDPGVPSGGAVAIIRTAHAVNRGQLPPLDKTAAATSSSCAAVRRIVWCRRWWSCAATACPKTWVSPPSRYRCCPPPGRAPAVRPPEPGPAGGAEPAGARQAPEAVGRHDVPGGRPGHADPEQLRRAVGEGRWLRRQRYFQRRRGRDSRTSTPAASSSPCGSTTARRYTPLTC